MKDSNTLDLIEQAANQGADGAFVRCVATDIDGRHIARKAVERTAVWDTDTIVGGGFITALADGRVEKAFARADTQSRKLMTEAGLVNSKGEVQ